MAFVQKNEPTTCQSFLQHAVLVLLPRRAASSPLYITPHSLKLNVPGKPKHPIMKVSLGKPNKSWGLLDPVIPCYFPLLPSLKGWKLVLSGEMYQGKWFPWRGMFFLRWSPVGQPLRKDRGAISSVFRLMFCHWSSPVQKLLEGWFPSGKRASRVAETSQGL